MLVKLLVLAGIIAIVLLAYGVAARLKRVSRAAEAGRVTQARRAGAARERKGEEMIQCAACGSYVLASRPEPCGRADCPF